MVKIIAISVVVLVFVVMALCCATCFVNIQKLNEEISKLNDKKSDTNENC